MKRFLKLNYLHDFLNKEQRTISLLNNIIFQIFYHDKIQLSSSIDANRLKIIIQIYQKIFDIKIKNHSIDLTKS